MDSRAVIPKQVRSLIEDTHLQALGEVVDEVGLGLEGLAQELGADHGLGIEIVQVAFDTLHT